MVNQIKEDILQAIEEMRKEEYSAYDAIIDDEGLEDFADNIDDYGVCSGGGVFGDHCSPISDTTAVSSLAAGCDVLTHVKTQFPYALVAGGLTLVGYLIASIIMIG